jgi:hypothetical protein
MENILALFVANLPTLVCLAGAVAVLLWRGPQSSGWGWLMVLALALAHSAEIKMKDRPDRCPHCGKDMNGDYEYNNE